MLERYEDIPDNLTAAEIDQWFIELLDLCEQSSLSRNEVADAVFNLSLAQWHTYQKIEQGIADRITSWIVANIDISMDLDLAESFASIIATLGLEEAYTKFVALLAEQIAPDVRKEIEDTIREFGDHVGDPFISLRDL
jgi:hypothetical protein